MLSCPSPLRAASPLFLAALTSLAADAFGHAPASRVIEFPDLPGYQTLVGDFHQHTVFSLVEIPAHASATILVKPIEPLTEIELRFEVLNAVTAPRVRPVLALQISAELPAPEAP